MRKIYKDKKQYRLPNYDYGSDGYYFVTIVTKNRRNLFGNIMNGKMQLSKLGEIVYRFWCKIPDHFKYAQIDEFTVMPNHIHGIIIINDLGRNGLSTVPTGNNSTAPPGNNSTIPALRTNGRQTIPADRLRTNGRQTVPADSLRTNGRQTIPADSLRTNGRKTVPTLQPQKQSLSIVIRNYKAAVTTWARRNNKAQNLWQSRFHDRIVRNENELYNIRNYIINNPQKWDIDRENFINSPI